MMTGHCDDGFTGCGCYGVVMRWPAVILLWLTGGVMVLYGVLVEIEVRRNVGTGVTKGLAEALFSGDIAAWRDHSAIWLVAGSLLVVVGLVVLRRGDPVRRAQRCRDRADRSAKWAREARTKAIEAADPDQSAAWRNAAEKHERQRQRYSGQADRAVRSATARAQAISREVERVKRG